MRASSLVSIAVTISGFIVGIFCPVIGAIVDSTHYRRALLCFGTFGMVVDAGLVLPTLSPGLWEIVWLSLILYGLFWEMSFLVSYCLREDSNANAIVSFANFSPLLLAPMLAR